MSAAPGTWDDGSVFYWVTKYTLGLSLQIIFRPRVWGAKNVPRHGPVILAGNHLSFADHFFGPLPVPRKVIFLAKAEYFNRPGLMGLISKAFFAGVGQIPVDRAGGAAGEQAIRTSLQVLAAGHVLGIYPEGTRSPDGRLYRGKTGVARLAVESGAPVVPMAMIDTFEFLPPSAKRPNPRFRPGVKFGEPLDFSRYRGQPIDLALLRSITDEIMHAIAKLSGQEYVDMDARRAKAELAKARAKPAEPNHDDAHRDNEAQTDEAQTDEAQTDEAQTGEAQTEEAQTDEAQTGAP
jgi:1-acyl-sn-glycerol-3-phosphate acyltransferase